MQMVITRVQLKAGTAEACADLFSKTNPTLVRNEPDWLEARMVIDRETNTIIVMALWRSAESYRAMSQGPPFQNAMRQFGEFFASPPDVSVTDVLAEMTAESISASPE